jgi:hypothetical protein
MKHGISSEIMLVLHLLLNLWPLCMKCFREKYSTADSSPLDPLELLYCDYDLWENLKRKVYKNNLCISKAHQNRNISKCFSFWRWTSGIVAKLVYSKAYNWRHEVTSTIHVKFVSPVQQSVIKFYTRRNCYESRGYIAGKILHYCLHYLSLTHTHTHTHNLILNMFKHGV